MEQELEQTEDRKKTFWDITFPIVRGKYTIVSLFFIIWVGFFDQNSWYEIIKKQRNLDRLKEKKEYFKNKIQKDQIYMKELISDKENLEKFARENYLMKKENEDVFIVID